MSAYKSTNTSTSNQNTNIVVFAASTYAQPVIWYLAQKEVLAGVIVPDPREMSSQAAEVQQLLRMLLDANIPVQACSKDNLTIIHQQFDQWHGHMGLIVGYPHILPSVLVEYLSNSVEFGCYNLHASTLPKYRGPQPLYWQIRNQERKSAIVLHKVEKEPDTGNIIVQTPFSIGERETLPNLLQRVAHTSVDLIASLLENWPPNKQYQQGETQQSLDPSLPQTINYARRLLTSDLTLDFNQQSPAQIVAQCLAGNGQAQSALFSFRQVVCNLMQATEIKQSNFGTEPGTILMIDEYEGVIVSVYRGALRLDVVSVAGGVYSGLAFAELFQIDAGCQLQTVSL
ncbi:methionyl-tRNA formyltransferase [Algibacillus agarilyticus]|uniref:methionyl-tRNA formyltransferase n=1 Tax=Algibacillus agarilyticus TaxID=2234133 RepID=UPI000DCFCC9D|nr:formyltransferase family protein [Algibacillus agarilyticus]